MRFLALTLSLVFFGTSASALKATDDLKIGEVYCTQSDGGAISEIASKVSLWSTFYVTFHPNALVLLQNGGFSLTGNAFNQRGLDSIADPNYSYKNLGVNSCAPKISVQYLDIPSFALSAFTFSCGPNSYIRYVDELCLIKN